ncbi:MAG: exodeoxyribonuclease VII small subunit [Lachnospiraceae bacterium]|nr:exodeoxyribonuclease VII small subunit [Lachnospiraceae bacterium]
MEGNQAESLKDPVKEPTIEETFEELDGILELLEDDGQPLEEAFRQFERGMKLIKSCSAQIDQVEKQILVLSGGEGHE